MSFMEDLSDLLEEFYSVVETHADTIYGITIRCQPKNEDNDALFVALAFGEDDEDDLDLEFEWAEDHEEIMADIGRRLRDHARGVAREAQQEQRNLEKALEAARDRVKMVKKLRTLTPSPLEALAMEAPEDETK